MLSHGSFLTNQSSRICILLAAISTLFAYAVSPIQAQDSGIKSFNLLDLTQPPKVDLKPTLKIGFEPKSAQAGEIVELSISIKLADQAYVYSQNPNIGAETKIQVNKVTGLTALDKKFQPDRKPKSVIEPLFDNAKLEKFYGGVTWNQRFQIADSSITQAVVTGQLIYQVCDESTCNPYQEDFTATLQIKSGQETIPLWQASEDHSDNKQPADPAPRILEELKGNVVAQQTLRSKQVIGEEDDPAEFVIQLVELSGPDANYVLQILAIPDTGWHIYAQNQDPMMLGRPTQIQVLNANGLSPLDESFLPNHEPEIYKPDPETIQHVFHNKVLWQQRFTQLDQSPISVSGTVGYQLCNDKVCTPPNEIQFSLNSDSTDQQASVPISISDNNSTSSQPGLFSFLLTGFIAGYVALLTPCVFPMVPITVSFFLKEAEKEHHKPVSLATIYCLSIIGTFTIIGLLVSIFSGATGMNALANNAFINILMAAVFVFFGMNMLGLFEIQVPAWMLTWSSNQEQQGGVAGVVFMAFTFTLVSFTCTFAFVGSLVVLAAQGNYLWPVMGMLAFSTAFASPFFFLAMFPSYLQKLPKSGGWMNNVKVTLGFIEIGAAFKFLSVADLSWNPEPFFFDYALVMSSWMIICVVTGMYLLNLFRLPHDTPSDKIGVIRLSFAMTFLGLAAYLATGIYGSQKPNGFVWQQIVAFAPPTFESDAPSQHSIIQVVDSNESKKVGPALTHDGLQFLLDVDQGIELAKEMNQPLFLEFTGVNCVNCRFMEKNIFPKPENRELLAKFVRVQLFTDNVPTVSNQQLASQLLSKNRDLQENWFGDASLPAYAVVTPDGKTILTSYKGSERSDGQFTRFLETGWTAWSQMNSDTARSKDSITR